MTMELRHLPASEIRSKAAGKKIEGYAATFNIFARVPNAKQEFQERMLPGCFTRAVREKQDVVCLFNHDSNMVLGRISSGTLRISQDSKGLFYECDLPNTQAARDLHSSIERGDINGCSFAFTIPDGGQTWGEGRASDGTYFIQRDISDVDLIDVSPVTHPCYSNTMVQARTAEVPVEVRSRVEGLNSGRIIAPKRSFYIPGFGQAIAQLRAFNQEHGGSFSLGEMYDANERRKRMMREIIDL